MRLHDDQLPVTAEVVAGLVVQQFPQWSHLPVRPVDADGTVNAIFRIGDRLAARLPLQAQDAGRARAQLESEAAAADELAACSAVPTPVPVALGAPGPGYPMFWIVQTWLPGDTAMGADVGLSSAFADDLATLIAGLRGADTRGRRFTGPGRGGHLPDHDAWMETCFERSTALLDVAPLRRLWRGFRALPPGGPEVMTHGDLVPGNLLVRDGRLVGLLDGGGFGPADPALDLVCAWHLLDPAPRQLLADRLGCGEIEWARGMAWAFQQAMGLVWYYAETRPALSRLGRRTLERLLDAA